VRGTEGGREQEREVLPLGRGRTRKKIGRSSPEKKEGTSVFPRGEKGEKKKRSFSRGKLFGKRGKEEEGRRSHFLLGQESLASWGGRKNRLPARKGGKEGVSYYYDGGNQTKGETCFIRKGEKKRKKGRVFLTRSSDPRGRSLLLEGGGSQTPGRGGGGGGRGKRGKKGSSAYAARK